MKRGRREGKDDRFIECSGDIGGEGDRCTESVFLEWVALRGE